MRVYLAGPIFGCTDAEANDWREEAKRLLVGHECVNPMTRDYRGKEAEHVADIVNGDLRDIQSCEAMLVNATRPSWGTAMEIRAASDYALHIVAFAPPPYSPWLAYHADCFATIDEAVDAVRRAERTQSKTQLSEKR